MHSGSGSAKAKSYGSCGSGSGATTIRKHLPYDAPVEGAVYDGRVISRETRGCHDLKYKIKVQVINGGKFILTRRLKLGFVSF